LFAIGFPILLPYILVYLHSELVLVIW